MEKDLNPFREFLAKKGLSVATQKAYGFSASGFIHWYGTNPELAQKQDILRYLGYLREKKGLQNSTRQYILYSLNYFYEYLISKGFVVNNPTALIVIRGTKTRKLQKTFSSQELDDIMDAYYQIYIRGFDQASVPQNVREQSRLAKERNYIMLSFFIYQGLVPRELNRLTINDLDLTNAKVQIYGKQVDRSLPLAARQIGPLMHYIHVQRGAFKTYCGDDDRLFFALPASGSNRTKSDNLTDAARHLSRQLKVVHPSYINLRQLRASRIVCWLKEHGLRKTQYMAGHKSIVSTEEYLPQEIEQLSKDIVKYNPF